MPASPPAPLLGTRLPDAVLDARYAPVAGPGWTAWKNGTCAAGSYMLVRYENGHRVWWFVDPLGHVGSLPSTTAKEEEDGTLTHEPIFHSGPSSSFKGTIKKGLFVWTP